MWKISILSGVVLFDGLLALSFLRQYRRHGSLGIFVRAGNYAQNIQDAATILLLVLLTWQAVRAARPSSSLLIETQKPMVELIRALGVVVLFGGIALCAVCQRNLGASWRIGVEEAVKPKLVTSGFYRFSRNPIFLALLITIAGYALLLPTGLSLVLLVGTYIGIRRQVAVEERYLLSTYGEAYRVYAQRVGRFVPVLGRMRALNYRHS
jgi:protein-S-isoprenylcysteine O-methyltransferase Ste14